MSFSFKPTQVGGEPQASSADSSSASPAKDIPIGGMPLGGRAGPDSRKTLFQVILYIVFGILLVIAVTLFAYQRYLVSRIESQKQVLDQEDKALGALNLEDMRALSNRMKVVNQVLAEHASVSTAFLILEKSIENPVTYTRFSLIRGEGNKGYDLQLGANAPSYKAVAQQLDTLKSDAYKKDFIPNLSFDGLTLDPSGRVNFNLKMPILIQGKLPESIFTNSTDVYDNSPISFSTTTEVEASTTITVASSTVVAASSTKKIK